jgi:hypothetical protein
MKAKAGLILLPLLGACATAGSREATDETYIPYVSSNGVVEWRATSDDTVYLRAVTGGWYRVQTMGRCSVLLDALSLGFYTSANGQLDRFGAILAEGRQCPVASVVRSDAPPEKQRGS